MNNQSKWSLVFCAVLVYSIRLLKSPMFKLLKAAHLHIILIPILFIILGAASNQAVLIANHDTFPVSINPIAVLALTGHVGGLKIKKIPDSGMLDTTHCIMTDKTRLNYLADIFDLHDKYVSIGDLFLDFGYWLWSFAPYLWGYTVIIDLRKKYGT